MSNGVYVDASGFGDAFEGILDDFFEQCTIDTKKAVQKGGNACKKQLQSTADPRMTGKYAAGWRMRTEYDRFGGYYVRVYNDHGYAVLKARVTEGIKPGVVSIPHGFQASQFVEGHTQDLTNVYMNDFCSNSAFYDFLCEVEKYEGGVR